MPKTTSKHVPEALLDHVLIKNWLVNVLSPATRKSRRDDLTSFIEYFKIKSIDDLKCNSTKASKIKVQIAS